MNVNAIGGVHPAFGPWLERRQERMRAQLSAIEDERFEDLAELLHHDEEEPPPQPRDEEERRQYLQMLREHEALTERLTEIRQRVLAELKDVERQQVQGSVPRHRGLGGSVDGYL